jgi:hypothetical protein
MDHFCRAYVVVPSVGIFDFYGLVLCFGLRREEARKQGNGNQNGCGDVAHQPHTVYLTRVYGEIVQLWETVVSTQDLF